MSKIVNSPTEEAANGAKRLSKLETVKKMLSDKEEMAKFFNGEISIEEVHSKGIKFVTPL